MISLGQNKQIVRRLVDEAQNEGDLEVADELLSEDFVDPTPLEGLPGNREGVRLPVRALRQTFPDLRADISGQMAENDRFVTRKTFRGTHGGPFLGLPAARLAGLTRSGRYPDDPRPAHLRASGRSGQTEPAAAARSDSGVGANYRMRSPAANRAHQIRRSSASN